jgi:hypothetical protein
MPKITHGHRNASGAPRQVKLPRQAQSTKGPRTGGGSK